MNLVSCFLCCSHAVNAIGRSGEGGRIVNVAARHALEWRGGAGLVAYTASKVAMTALTVLSLRSRRGYESLSSAVALSIMDTPANGCNAKGKLRGLAQGEEVAATILFLASPETR